MSLNTLKKTVVLCFVVLLCASRASAGEITVSAAASLTNAFTEIKALFEKKQAGVNVVTNFAASNPLLQQIREGAPVDVFASADQETMEKAQAEKLIDPATRKDFARNALVMIVPEESKRISAEDLSPAMRIAVGNPESVPAGRYARDALTALGSYEKLQPAFIFGNSVRQVLDYVARGEVDAGFVYASDAVAAKGKVVVAQTMTGHKPVLYPVALVLSGKNKESGRAFIEFLFSQAAAEVMQKHGFSKP